MKKYWWDVLWRTDWLLLGALFSLTAIGLLMIYGIGASYESVSLVQFRKQIIAVSIGFVVMAVLALVDYRQIRNLSTVIYVVGFFMLTSVLIFGTTIRGTQGWFAIGNITVQPVELAKITFAVFLAAYFSKHVHKRLTWIPFFGSLLALMGYVIPILLQPDFGSAMVIVAMWLVAVAFAGLRWRDWFIMIGAIAVLGALVWGYGFKPYQRDRLLAFMHPEYDPLGAGYNVLQAQTAIGSGGLLGKGVGQGSQTRLRFLPEASTDFMFAVIGEELGFLGVSLVLCLFGVFVFRLVRVGQRSGDPFAGIFCVCIAGMFGMHVWVNAGMNMGIMPVTGIPLPFSSAAASALVAGYAAMGMVQSISIHARPAPEATD